MIEIVLNGKPEQVDEAFSVADLLARVGRTQGLAVEINREVVPRSQHAATRFRAGDRVEIVHMVAGG
jgi:sulfur carrier protein